MSNIDFYKYRDRIKISYLSLELQQVIQYKILYGGQDEEKEFCAL